MNTYEESLKKFIEVNHEKSIYGFQKFLHPNKYLLIPCSCELPEIHIFLNVYYYTWYIYDTFIQRVKDKTNYLLAMFPMKTFSKHQLNSNNQMREWT